MAKSTTDEFKKVSPKAKAEKPAKAVKTEKTIKAEKAAKSAKPEKAKKESPKTKGTSTRSTIVSKGKFKTVRQLMDALFTKKREKLTYEEAEKAVNAEFSGTAFNKNHFAWYRYHILTKDERGKRTA